jgi:hypothetical protein
MFRRSVHWRHVHQQPRQMQTGNRRNRAAARPDNERRIGAEKGLDRHERQPDHRRSRQGLRAQARHRGEANHPDDRNRLAEHQTPAAADGHGHRERQKQEPENRGFAQRRSAIKNDKHGSEGEADDAQDQTTADEHAMPHVLNRARRALMNEAADPFPKSYQYEHAATRTHTPPQSVDDRC